MHVIVDDAIDELSRIQEIFPASRDHHAYVAGGLRFAPGGRFA